MKVIIPCYRKKTCRGLYSSYLTFHPLKQTHYINNKNIPTILKTAHGGASKQKPKKKTYTIFHRDFPLFVVVVLSLFDGISIPSLLLTWFVVIIKRCDTT